MTKGQEIVASGGQILLPFALGDAQVTFASRWDLAARIDGAIMEAVMRALDEARREKP